MSGETLDVGIDGTSVGPYPLHFPFTGTIHRVEVVIAPEISPQDRADVAYGIHHAATAAH